MFLEWEWVTLGGLFSNFYSDFDSFCLFGIFLNFLVFGVFWGNFWVFEIFENVFGMRMGDFGGVYLVTFIQILPPSAFFWAMSKNGWMDVGCWMLDVGYLKPVKPRAPCRANNTFLHSWLLWGRVSRVKALLML